MEINHKHWKQPHLCQVFSRCPDLIGAARVRAHRLGVDVRDVRGVEIGDHFGRDAVQNDNEGFIGNTRQKLLADLHGNVEGGLKPRKNERGL